MTSPAEMRALLRHHRAALDAERAAVDDAWRNLLDDVANTDTPDDDIDAVRRLTIGRGTS